MAACIALKRALPPRTHDLVRLMGEAGVELPEDLRRNVAEPSPYYTVARYPNVGMERPWESIERGTAERLLEAAERVVREVGRLARLERAGGAGED